MNHEGMESKRKRFKELHDKPTLDIDRGYLDNASASNYWAESLASSSHKMPTIKQGNHFQAHYREFPLDGGDSDNDSTFIELPDRQFGGEQPQESTSLINSKEAFEMDSLTSTDNTLTIDFSPPMTDQPPVQSAARKSATPKPLMHSRASSYFSDGMRRIDFVLAYDPSEKENKDVDEEATTSGSSGRNSPQRHIDKRKMFETNLQLLGLELEHAAVRNTHTRFVLIHAPFKVLLKQAEVMNVKMPVHQNDIKKPTNIMEGAVNIFLKRFKFLDFDEKIKKRIEPADYFTQPFIEQHLECFVNHENQETFFSYCDRSRMVYDLLIRTRYDKGEKDKFRFGIERLVQGRTYSAAYPLHDEINYSQSEVNFDECSDRQLLWETWVKTKNICKYQPLHLIKNYFGTKIGFYFAWLGYYTRFLYVISMLGVLCVLFGVATMSDDISSNDVCGEDGIGGKVLICPVCEKNCDYTPLSSSCIYAKLTYVFDNGATIIFAAIMSIWATLFLECWKRYHAELAYKWNVLDYEREQEVMRPEFQFRQSKFKVNPVTQQREPYVPFAEKAMRIFGSSVVVLFFLCMVVALVIGIVAYRIIVMHVFYTMEDNDFLQSKAVIITSVTAASINLVFILIMNYFYNALAFKLTDLECPRTQTDFDNSYALKVFLFQFINFYSSLFYIAFIKGRFSGAPSYNANSTSGITIFGQRLEDCDPSGCMVELVIQLFIIMCGKQVFNAFMEIGYPIITHWFRRWRFHLPETKKQRWDRIRQESQMAMQSRSSEVPLFERDFVLNPVYEQFLFDEYLEMVIQFGFVTLFVAAFPLAPLFALLNNILEIRLDAYKFIVTTRRPIPSQAKNIGIWMTILDLLSNVAVLCNAFVIAFTSDFIPKLYYYMTHYSLIGFVDDSLSYYDATSIPNITKSDYPNATICRFRDYRRPPCNLSMLDAENHCSEDYAFQNKWWVILALRLSFVLVFELLILSIKAIFAYIIPDMPTKVVIQLQRERYLARQAILQKSDITSTRFSPDSVQQTGSNGSELSSNLARSNDVEDIAYQPGQETNGQPPSSSQQQNHWDNFRRIYSNRRRPSLSPHSSHANLHERELSQKSSPYLTIEDGRSPRDHATRRERPVAKDQQWQNRSSRSPPEEFYSAHGTPK